MKVIIVGCGLSGLSLALALVAKSDGVDVSIVEKRADFASRGATIGLAPNGQIAMQEICPSVLAHVKRVGVLIPQTGGFMLPWWEIRDSLLEEAQKHKTQIKIHLGLTIDTIEEFDDTVTVRFKGLDDMTLQGSFLVGADGVHSFIRTQILQLPQAMPTGAYVWRGRINVQEIASLQHMTDIPVARLDTFGQTIVAYFNFHQTLPGTIAWVVSSKLTDIIVPGVTTPMDLMNLYLASSAAAADKESTRDENSSDDDDLMQKVNDAKLVFANTESSEDLTFATELCVTNLDSSGGWGGRGRITLVGDAAHALRPASGLGGSLAFEDSVILARMLTDEASSQAQHTTTDGGGEVLRAFEERRLPRVKSISDDQTMRSESSYKKDVKVPGWSKEYRDWIFMGPDAPSHPPKEE